MTHETEGLYNPAFEKDGCGIGFVANIKGARSHSIIEDALTVLENLTHRGAAGSDPNTGDGAGIMIQVPHELLREDCDAAGIRLAEPGAYGVGMLFLPRDADQRRECEALVERVVGEEGCRFLGWRDVPVDPDCLGVLARSNRPYIRQCFIARDMLNPDAFERRLYLIRRVIENAVGESAIEQRESFYIPSMSSRTMVYKGLMLPSQFTGFYPDLADGRADTALALVHQRFSTNTFPSWRLAHPYRLLCHNGEINTLRGNVSLMRAREGRLSSELFGEDINRLYPIIGEGQSDSASLDNAAEFLLMGGRSLPHVMMMLIPEAWSGNPRMDLARRGFYDYHHEIMGPWDGPAAVAFTDGRLVGAALDANGLRPLRYLVTRDDRIVLASEAGVLPVDAPDVRLQNRLKPGEMLVVDTVEGRLRHDDEIKSEIAARQPYRDWVATHRINLSDLPEPLDVPQPDHVTLRRRQMSFGYTIEELKMVLTPMAINGMEPIGSMGTDTPLAVLSKRPQLLFNYFKQLFAQVTNPPIDPIRERLVMSLDSHIGPEGDLLAELPEHARRIRIRHPILTNADLEKIRSVGGDFETRTLKALFPAAEGKRGLAPALDALCAQAENAVKEGSRFVVLSDRGVDREWAPIPSLLATSAVHHHLLAKKMRTEVGLIVETGEAREVHHFACLVGFGAGSINPYLAFETLNDMAAEGFLPDYVDPETAEAKFIKAVDKGLLKIFSKLGITAFRSYLGAHLLEAVGLGADFVDRYFTGAVSRIGGIGIEEVASDTLKRHREAYREVPKPLRHLDPGGEFHFRAGGEQHGWGPRAVSMLQQAVRDGSREKFGRFSAVIEEHHRTTPTIRGMLEPTTAEKPVPLDEVEPASEIVKRFNTGAMSFGSISKETHETIAIAMNRLGGKSNTGEGGEDPARFKPMRNGDSRNSYIKQVASARFGVTTHYLVNAREIQIKISQGAKPGEGGQLPGHKVNDVIALARHATPGVELISPPPHHDIYSIEDLAQLIHDLKNVNPRASISVKLVSEVGVGTVAAGVAKAHADKILISGFSGGTGAATLTSIKNAGIPWEMGLSETHQTLVRNDLRGRVRLETDGQLRTGRDVLIAALLGAEEFGFGTAVLVCLGCVLMRKCHLNTCPVGVATQDPLLRKNFSGRPEYVTNFFNFVAEEVREWMARLGFRRLEDMVGRSDLLSVVPAEGRPKSLDLSRILHVPGTTGLGATHHIGSQGHHLDVPMARKIVACARPALEDGKTVEASFEIRNVHRSVGAMLAGEIARRFGPRGLPDDTIRLKFKGSAGQSFGAWCSGGLTLMLEGEANDYLGKGLSGGRIVVTPFEGYTFAPEETCLVGNVALYGATGGEVFLHGMAGERFAVRNSGARAVVEGVGDHGCEYMTGGDIVVLGATGRNFAAGMSGGRAFVFDETGDFSKNCNRGMVGLGPVEDHEDVEMLGSLLERHVRYTSSPRARSLLDNWDTALGKFVLVMPREYRRILEDRRQGFDWSDTVREKTPNE
ncbi:MAG: glutamate synthase large subunit [Deltaproteobacteria bacterium]|nr:glutamate synthase large subunit [Deltaproteobacteria bacterium]